MKVIGITLPHTPVESGIKGVNVSKYLIIREGYISIHRDCFAIAITIDSSTQEAIATLIARPCVAVRKVGIFGRQETVGISVGFRYTQLTTQRQFGQYLPFYRKVVGQLLILTLVERAQRGIIERVFRLGSILIERIHKLTQLTVCIIGCIVRLLVHIIAECSVRTLMTVVETYRGVVSEGEVLIHIQQCDSTIEGAAVGTLHSAFYSIVLGIGRPAELGATTL